jgi:ankyrin repeat protein
MMQPGLFVLLTALSLGSVTGPRHFGGVQSKDQTPTSRKQGSLTADEVSFIEAARKGDSDAVKRFFEAGMDANLVDQRDEELSTVLMVAAMAGQTETMKVLLARGAAVNARTRKGRTALTWASWRGMTETARTLLANDAEINSRDQWGSTPLGFAVSKGRLDTVQMLLDAGADPNPKHKETGQTPLIDAIVRGYTDIVRVLVAKGADVHASTRNGRTAIEWARLLKHPEMEALLKAAKK